MLVFVTKQAEWAYSLQSQHKRPVKAVCSRDFAKTDPLKHSSWLSHGSTKRKLCFRRWIVSGTSQPTCVCPHSLPYLASKCLSSTARRGGCGANFEFTIETTVGGGGAGFVSRPHVLNGSHNECLWKYGQLEYMFSGHSCLSFSTQYFISSFLCLSRWQSLV